ncbi:protein kinase [Streptomyces sp. NPDC091273]|uniref:serine/threonine-protein kinase n=1 Tax=Streptomyces sp. NPDC091273 TaxID=3365982 RepID=UPI00382CE309
MSVSPPRAPLAPLTHDDPQALGDFRLLARLGSGGMGTVYLARSAGGRTVALKTVHTRIAADTTFRTRFRLESDAARVIGDRYGARVFGSDAVAATPWLATEYVIGPQLDEAVRLAGPLPEECVRSLGADLALALGQLHRSDVVHRDLKPSNIMVTAAGPKVIDFGIARALGDERLTRTGAAAGTPAFMSPEQAGGLEHSPAGDVFALAGVLVFAASGHGPFGGGQAADLLYRVRYAEPDLGGVPAALSPLLARCLAKDPAQRPTTAELAGLLAPGGAPFADGLPQPVLADIARRAAAVWQEPPLRLPAPAVEPDTVVGAGGGMSRRRLFAVTGAAAGGVALAAGGGLWAWLGGRDRDGDGDGDGAKDAGQPALQPPPDPLWQDQGNHPPRVGGTPLSVNGMLVMARGITTVGLSPQDGKYLMDFHGFSDVWRVATDGKVLYGIRKPDAADKALAVVPLSLENGKEQAPLVQLPAYDGTNALNQILGVDGDSVFLCAKAAGSGQWSVVAASLKSGKELWRQPTAAPTANQVELGRPSLVRAKAVRGGVLLWQRADTGDALRVSLHDAGSGAERWAVSLEAPGATPDQPATDDQHVYVGAQNLQALRLTDGQQAWSFGEGHDVGKVIGQRRYGMPAVRDGIVYAVQGTRGIVAISATFGTLQWTDVLPEGANPNRDIAPVVTPSHIYSMDATGLRAVRIRTQSAVWHYQTSASILTPDPDGKRLYLREAKKLIALPLP